MDASINQARREVQDAFEGALRCAERRTARRFHEFDVELWTGMLALGRALVVLFLAHQCALWRRQDYVHGGRRYEVDQERTMEIGTRYGKVLFRRPVGRRAGASRGKVDLPVDRALGLVSGFTLNVVMTMAKFCAQMAFAGGRGTYRDIFEWTPSPRAVLRMVDAVGDEARPFLEQAPPPEDDGEILVVQMDARGAPMISETEYRKRARPHSNEGGTRRHGRRRRRKGAARPRRKKGQKSKNCKVAFMGVLYTLRRTPDGLEGPINKRLIATFESHEALFIWLRREADKRGYGRKETIFLADGSDHIWRLQEIYFPDAKVCVDWYHVVEYLWSAGQSLHEEGSQELAAWVGRQVRRLRRGATMAIIKGLRESLAKIPRTGPGNKGRRERLEKTIDYIVGHLHRLNYVEFRAHDYDIGSGAAEGAIKNLIGARLDGGGMRWGRQRSERVLLLRCILLNGQWDDFTCYLAKRRGFTLAAKPGSSAVSVGGYTALQPPRGPCSAPIWRVWAALGFSPPDLGGG